MWLSRTWTVKLLGNIQQNSYMEVHSTVHLMHPNGNVTILMSNFDLELYYMPYPLLLAISEVGYSVWFVYI